ncbi:MAG: hypothetical protein JXQ71_11755 [Verrucomicrobia bacterium]|nr:hypothetical protein [Verrucomicrobiota bacterium]
MKTFQSSLEGLRVLRERQEQDALHAYGEALQTQEQARCKLEAVQSEWVECWSDLRRRLAAKIAGAELQRLKVYGQTLDRHRRAAEHALEAARQHARLAFTRLLCARQARTVVAKAIAARKHPHPHHRPRHAPRAPDELARRRDSLFTLVHTTRRPLWN